MTGVIMEPKCSLVLMSCDKKSGWWTLVATLPVIALWNFLFCSVEKFWKSFRHRKAEVSLSWVTIVLCRTTLISHSVVIISSRIVSRLTSYFHDSIPPLKIPPKKDEASFTHNLNNQFAAETEGVLQFYTKTVEWNEWMIWLECDWERA